MKTRLFIVGICSILLIAGCGQDESTTYEVPKESSSAPAQTQSVMGSQSDMEAVQAAHSMMEKALPQNEFSADLPEGWTEKTGSGMRKASWTIGETSIDFYLIALSMGDVPSNVNRWRGQVGLPEATPEEIDAAVVTLDAEGHAVSYIEIYNEEGGKGIIAAILDLAPSYWYFTAKGSVEELKANADDIRAFIGSIKFEGHNH
jgi:hypothetical protein